MYNNLIGVYKIENIANGMCYIGSSMNIGDRWKRHLRHFKNKNHCNQHLLNAWLKYGPENFTFTVLKTFDSISLKDLQEEEEIFINNYKFENLYNKTKLACGGSDCVSIPCYILHLDGSIASEHQSLSEAARFYKTDQISTSSVNTGAVYNKKYRVVTKQFYLSNDISKLITEEFLYHYKLKYELEFENKISHHKSIESMSKILELPSHIVRRYLKKNLIDNEAVIDYQLKVFKISCLKTCKSG